MPAQPGSSAADGPDSPSRLAPGAALPPFRRDAPAVIEVSCQPHTDADSLPAGARLTLQVAALQGPARTGWRRLAYGPGPAESVLVLRRRVEVAIRDTGRSVGAFAAAGRPPPLEGMLTAGIVAVVALSMLALAHPATSWLSSHATAVLSGARPQPPATATFCPPERIVTNRTPAAVRHPTRSAASRTGACPLAEATRARWLTVPAGKRSTLKVLSPATGRTSTLRCSGKALIVCTRGTLTIWLYSP